MDTMTMSVIVGLLAGIILGGAIAFVIINFFRTKKRNQIIKDAEAKADGIMKDKMVKAKEKFLELKEEHEKTISERSRRVQSSEDRIKHKEIQLSKQIESNKRKDKEIEAVRTNLDKQLEVIS